MKSFLRKNWGLKLFALSLAIFLEFQFNNPKTSELRVEVYVRNLPQNRTIISPRHAERGLSVTALIRGPGPLVDGLGASEQRLYIDVPQGAPKSFTANLDRRQLRVPAGVEVVRIEPPHVTFELERLVRRELPVKIEYTGTPAEGFVIKKVQAYPNSIVARGPLNELSGITEISTREIDIDRINGSRSVEVALNDIGRNTVLDINLITVTFEIVPIELTKRFDNLNIEVIAPPGFAARVEPIRAGIKVAGSQRLIEQLTPAMIKLVADGTGLAEGKHELTLVARLPENIEAIKSYPDKVILTLVTSENK